MKKYFLSILMLAGISVSAQSPSAAGIQLNKGQIITVTAVSESNTDMGMGGEMTSNARTTSVITVTDVTAEGYKLSNTTTKIKMDMSMMGQEIKYDSENPGEENEMTKSISDNIGKAETGSLNKMTGDYAADKSASDEEENPIQSIMGGSQENESISSAFFVIPAGKKQGDSWDISSNQNGIKVSAKYTIVSMEKGKAVVSFDETADMNKTSEMQGMEMLITMSTKSKGEMTVNSSTGLVQQKTSTISADGNLEIMGQSTPITVSGKNTITYSY